MSFFAELKRRNVFRAGIAYAVIAWVTLQVVDFVVQLIGAPNWVLQIFFVAAAIGLLAVLIFSWVFEMTPEGVRRESRIDRSQSITPQTGRKLDRIIIVFLAVAVALLVSERFMNPAPAPEQPAAAQPAAIQSAQTTPLNNKSVAVLPFVALSSGEDDGYFADGLTEEILNSLAQLPELLVTARTSAFSFKGQDLPVQEIAEQLGVRHIVEGSVRRSGDRLRITAQLIRATDGFQLWSDNYDSTATDTIAMQEDIAEEIALALDVVLDADRREAMRRAGLRDPAAFVAFQKGLEAMDKGHGADDQVAELLKARVYFEQVLELVPGYPPALIDGADPYVHMLNDAASNDLLNPATEPELQQALQLVLAELALAAENARSPAERDAIVFDLSVLGGNLRGIRPQIEALLADDSCTHPTWIDPLASLFGYAQQLRERLAEIRACDPRRVTVWFSEARAALWAGDPQGALDLIARSEEENLSHPWLRVTRTQAEIALGQFETVLNRKEQLPNAWERSIVGSWVAAAQGERTMSAKLAADAQEAFGPGSFFSLQAMARIGNRAEANRLAAEIDQVAYGPLPLALITLWCTCGAPFDLEATPNFAAALREGGLPWPPPSPISFPLKDW
jgi:TolB-like protein